MNTIPAALGRSTAQPRRRRAFALSFAAATIGALAAAATASAGLLTPEAGGSSNADDILTLYNIVLAVAAVVFIGVEGAIFYSLFKFRARRGQVAAQIRGNTRLEIGWTVGAALILVVLAVVTFVQLGDIRNPPESDPTGFQAGNTVLVASADRRLPPSGESLNIEVNGQQYVWRYTYPGDAPDANVLDRAFSYTEMVVPTGTTVTLDIKAQDVAHSWWIPKLGGKFDAVPGHTNYTWFKIPEGMEGEVFTGQCAELCGRNHPNMVARVRAVSPAEFEQYLAGKREEIEAANAAAQLQRQELEGTEGEEPEGAEGADDPEAEGDAEDPGAAPEQDPE
jgi:cytochrome c oxidase subunit 2